MFSAVRDLKVHDSLPMSLSVDNFATPREQVAISILLGKGIEVITDRNILLREYSSDRSKYDPVIPDFAVRPKNVEEVAEVVRTCCKNSIPIVARGAGTGLEGQAVPIHRGCVIDMRQLQRFELLASDGMCWAGAGLYKTELNSKLQKYGLVFGPDPASNPTLGGMASTAGSGMSTVKYGTTRENVVSLIVVTAEGKIIQTRQPVRKSSSGLDLTQLYCGSEGTLGVICEILVRVFPIAPFRSGGLITFPNTAEAVKAVVYIRTKTNISSIVRLELLNEEGIRAGNVVFKTKLEEVPTLLVELQGASSHELSEDFKHLATTCALYNSRKVQFCAEGNALDAVWDARRGCTTAAMRIRNKGMEKVYVTDVCVPMESLSAVVEETERDFRENGFPAVICAHIADGNFHCNIPFTGKEELQRLLAVEDRMISRAIRAGGTVSGEHGVGLGKLRHLVTEHGHDHIEVQQRIKKSLDPKNLMNPGKFYPKL